MLWQLPCEPVPFYPMLRLWSNISSSFIHWIIQTGTAPFFKFTVVVKLDEHKNSRHRLVKIRRQETMPFCLMTKERRLIVPKLHRPSSRLDDVEFFLNFNTGCSDYLLLSFTFNAALSSKSSVVIIILKADIVQTTSWNWLLQLVCIKVN